MNTRWLQVLPDGDAASRHAADVIAGRLRAAVEAKGRFRLAVSGGSTPWLMFTLLAAQSLPWSHVEIYQVAERVVAAGDPDRNLTHLTATLGATGASIFPMPVDEEDLAAAAARYADALPSSFDLVHLGLGPEGHTASLVPGDSVLDVDDRDVAMCGPYQGWRRMTLTYRGLSKAEEVLWLVTGPSKATPLARLCAGDPGIPASLVTVARALIVTHEAAAHAVNSDPPEGAHLWHRNASPSSLTSTGR